MCKVTNGNYESIELLKSISKRNRKKNKLLKNSKMSLDEIATNYGLKDWKELINYSVLPLHKKEKSKNNQEFSRLESYIYKLTDLIHSIINAHNKKSHHLFQEIYKRLNGYEQIYTSDFELLNIVFYIFLNSSKSFKIVRLNFSFTSIKSSRRNSFLKSF